MKYLRQFAIILAVTCAGEILKYFIPLPIPASVYGLVLMFVLLCTHIVPLADVKETGEFLIEIMPVMFIPAGVGLLEYWTDLKPILIPVCIITVISTVLVMALTGIITQAMLRKKRRKEETDG